MEKGTNRSSRLIALACRVRSSTLVSRPLGTPELSAAGSIYEFFNSAFRLPRSTRSLRLLPLKLPNLRSSA